jgi:hypothetical protein
MDSACVLEWEMHGVETFVSFRARRSERGFGVFVTRDGDTFLLSDTAADGAALFRKSQELRAALRDMGYSPKRAARRESHLTGGVCWGPAAPVGAVLLQAINEAVDHLRPQA